MKQKLFFYKGLLKGHKISSFFLLLYMVWWGFFINWFVSGNSKYPNSCGASNGALIFIGILIVLAYIIVLSLKIFFSKEENKDDYIQITGIVLIIPGIIFIIPITFILLIMFLATVFQ